MQRWQQAPRSGGLGKGDVEGMERPVACDRTGWSAGAWDDLESVGLAVLMSHKGYTAFKAFA